MCKDYSEALVAIKQEIGYLETALIQEKFDKVPKILRNIEIETDYIDLWLYKQENGLVNRKVV